jgi:hypothetical protein
VYSASIDWIKKNKTQACWPAHQPSQPNKGNTREQVIGAAGSAAELGRDVAGAVGAVKPIWGRASLPPWRPPARWFSRPREMGHGRALEWNQEDLGSSLAARGDVGGGRSFPADGGGGGVVERNPSGFFSGERSLGQRSGRVP